MGGTRTLNPLRETDFESVAYTIPPPWRMTGTNVANFFLFGNKQNPLQRGGFVVAGVGFEPTTFGL